MKARVDGIGDFEFFEITPQAIAELLLAHPRISRVWYHEETKEFAALTDAGMKIFTIGFPGDEKTFC